MKLQDLEKRLLQIIDELYASDEVKRTLRDAVEKEGVTVALVEETRAVIEESIRRYQAEAAAKIQELEERLDSALREYDERLSKLDREALSVYQETLAQDRENQLNSLRKKMNDI